MYLAFVPGSWHRAVKTLGISGVIGMSFVTHHEPLLTTSDFMLMRRLRVDPLQSLRWADHQKDQVKRKLELWVPSTKLSRKGRVAGD